MKIRLSMPTTISSSVSVAKLIQISESEVLEGNVAGFNFGSEDRGWGTGGFGFRSA